jgi:hypothetical protein
MLHDVLQVRVAGIAVPGTIPPRQAPPSFPDSGARPFQTQGRSRRQEYPSCV